MINGRNNKYYIWNNGRRCYKYYKEKSPYYFPNDKAEQKRINLIYKMFKLWLNGKLYTALIDNLRYVLDVDTETEI
jgi:beta-galactosidase beta subunit